MQNVWRNLSIRNKLMAFLGVIVFSISLFCLYLLATIHSDLDNFNEHVDEYFRVNVLQQHNARNDRLIVRYFDDFRMDNLAEFNQCVDEFHFALRKIQARPHSLESYLVLRSIQNAFVSYSDEINTAIKKQKSGAKDYQIHYYNASRINHYMETYIGQLLELTLQEGNSTYDALAAEARMRFYFSAVLICGIIVMCMLFGVAFSNHLIRPITQLAKVAQQMSRGNLQVKDIAVASNDEVGMLAESFNLMSTNIRKLVGDLQEKSLIEERLHREELQNSRNMELLKEARFLALQSQINPHFLFNALNTISRVVTFGRLSEAINLIDALSKILRYNMGNSKASATLQEELEIVRQYAFIQQYRFGKRLQIDIQCNNIEVSQILMPRFTLQPIVENAVIHGLEPRVSGGRLRIKVFHKDEFSIVKITDNGGGMGRKKLDEIIARLNPGITGHTSSIGLTNVMQRLAIFCQRQDCFDIRSKIGLGTVITLKVPRTGAI